MKRGFLHEAEKYIEEYQKQKRWHRVVAALACVTAFYTVCALIQSGITMATEHTHSEACYTQVTSVSREQLACSAESLNLHEHSSSCYDSEGNLVCGYADFVVHKHDSSCYDEDGNLWCALPEIEAHEHTSACYDRITKTVYDPPAGTVRERESAEQVWARAASEPAWAMVAAEPEEEEKPAEPAEEEKPAEPVEKPAEPVEKPAEPVEEEKPVEPAEEEKPVEPAEEEKPVKPAEEEKPVKPAEEEKPVKPAEEEKPVKPVEEEKPVKPAEEEKPVEPAEEEEPAEPEEEVEIDDREEGNEIVEWVLTCDEEEIVLHEHTGACFDEWGNLTCGKIQILAHQHTGACFETVEEPVDTRSLTCGLSEDENHTHSPLCYGTWELTCGKEEHSSDREDLESREDDILNDILNGASGEEIVILEPDGELDALPGPMEGTLNVSLLYGDQKPQEEHPKGEFSYTHSTMSGYIKLEPSGLTNDLTDVLVTLTIPKEYVEKNSVNIPRFISSSSYEIIPVTEQGENYCVSIRFLNYDKTQTLVLPFALSFLDDVVPDNYELPVTASVSCGGSILGTTDPNLYKPLYKEWGIDKFVNTNRINDFKNDGTQVVVAAQEEDGNPYLDDGTYVNFAFRVNNVINGGSNLNDFRDASSVTLTDRLPAYIDKDGNSRTAVFDPEVNPGWMLSEDGKTVSKTYTGVNSSDVLNQIYNDNDTPLKLRFPGLAFEGDNGALSARLSNEVDLVAEPSNRGEGEPDITANDPLRFVMTTEAGTKGSFTKIAQKGNIYDTDTYKTNPYPWRVRISNNGVTPLEHILIQDRKIVEDGKVVLAGMNEDLKFVRLESDLGDSIPAAGRTFADMVDRVTAYYTDGTTQEYPISSGNINDRGNFTIEFDSSRVCDGYEIIFRDDFQLLSTEAVSFMAYTVYRDPDNTHVPEGSEKIRYDNTARSVNTYMQGGQPVNAYLTVTHGYDMLPVTENLEIGKSTYANSATENNMVGSRYRYWISLAGSLSKEKEYEKMYIVDLLPNEVDFTKVTHGSELFTGGGSRYPGVSTGVSATPRIEENYHNSGRTALIWELPYETLMMHLASKENGLYYVVFQIEVQIREDAHPGTVRNDIYVVGDNLEEYTGKTGGTEDIYDLNNNGRRDDRIACSSSNAIIIAGQSIYSEKLIAPAGSDNWNKQGLSLTAGTEFDYLLKVTNETSAEHTGLIVYDTLPANHDKGIFSVNNRGSEFPVRLRGAIAPPEGYTVYYTTSMDAYQKSMSEMIGADIWTDASGVEDWPAVTAFKLTANEGTALPQNSPFQVRIPACVPDKLSAESMNLLSEKTYQDQNSGTMAYLQANNSFGFQTDQAAAPKESNTVWVRIPFAGFTLQKVDSESKEGVEGAEFTLADENGTAIQNGISDENGFLEFRDLTAGEYTLTETKVPSGYLDDHISLSVTITQDPVTMEYAVKFGDPFTGAGTASDPLCIENKINNYQLPATGGTGIALYLVGGLLLAVSVSLLLYIPVKRKRV